VHADQLSVHSHLRQPVAAQIAVPPSGALCPCVGAIVPFQRPVFSALSCLFLSRHPGPKRSLERCKRPPRVWGDPRGLRFVAAHLVRTVCSLGRLQFPSGNMTVYLLFLPRSCTCVHVRLALAATGPGALGSMLPPPADRSG